MPGELGANLRKHRADVGPGNTLLDRLAAAGAGRDLPVGVKSDQFAAAKHALRLLGGAADEWLRQHFIGERAGRVQLLQRTLEIRLIAHEPDAAARGTYRSLDHAGKADGVAQFIFGFDDARFRLRQAQFVE